MVLSHQWHKIRMTKFKLTSTFNINITVQSFPSFECILLTKVNSLCTILVSMFNQLFNHKSCIIRDFTLFIPKKKENPHHFKGEKTIQKILLSHIVKPYIDWIFLRYHTYTHTQLLVANAHKTDKNKIDNSLLSIFTYCCSSPLFLFLSHHFPPSVKSKGTQTHHLYRLLCVDSKINNREQVFQANMNRVFFHHPNSIESRDCI